MAVKGFNVGGAINRYDFNSLVNKEGAVTADMLGSDVTTQLTTMSGNISTLQSQVATLNDGYAQLGCTYTLHTATSTVKKESWKWNDGTLICALRKVATVELTIQSGALYWMAYNPNEAWPIAFKTNPACTFSTTGQNGQGNCFVWGSTDASTTQVPDVFVGRGTSASATVCFNFIAIGRWK